MILLVLLQLHKQDTNTKGERKQKKKRCFILQQLFHTYKALKVTFFLNQSPLQKHEESPVTKRVELEIVLCPQDSSLSFNHTHMQQWPEMGKKYQELPCRELDIFTWGGSCFFQNKKRVDNFTFSIHRGLFLLAIHLCWDCIFILINVILHCLRLSSLPPFLKH